VRQLEKYVASGGLDEVIRTYGGVNQADRRRLSEIVDENFEDQLLDVVVDDCLHRYEETRASFNELSSTAAWWRFRDRGLVVGTLFRP
jgi:hypothetical protein